MCSGVKWHVCVDVSVGILCRFKVKKIKIKVLKWMLWHFPCKAYKHVTCRILVVVFSPWVVSDSLWCHGLGPTRLPCPWDFPGKSAGVGCHFLLQGNLPDPEIELTSPTLTGRFFTTEPPGNPSRILHYLLFYFKFRRIEWKKLMDCSILPLSPFYHSNRNSDVKLLSIYQFRKKILKR